MARAAYGELLSADDESVRYRFAVDPWVQWDGVVTIPAGDVRLARTEDGADLPFAAQAIVARAHRAHQADGSWPQSVRFVS